VITATNIEMSSQPPWMNQSGDKELQAAVQEPQAFSESLKVASGASSEAETSTGADVKIGRRQKSIWDTTRPLVATPKSAVLVAVSVLPQVVPERALLTQPLVPTGFPAMSRSDSSLPQNPSAPAGDPSITASSASSSSNAGAGVDTDVRVQSSSGSVLNGPATVFGNLTDITDINAGPQNPLAASKAAATPASEPSNPAPQPASSPTVVDGATSVAAGYSMPRTLTGEAIAPSPILSEISGIPMFTNPGSHGKKTPDISANATDAPSSQAEPNQTVPFVTDPNGVTATLNPAVATVDQLASFVQSGGSAVLSNRAIVQVSSGKPVANMTIPAKVGSKDNSKDSPKDGVDLKQSEKDAPVATDVAGTPSGDQIQRGSSSQPQNSPSSPVPPNHSPEMDVHVQNTATILSTQIATSSVAIDSHPAKTTDIVAPVPVPVEQPLPSINTAKLVQDLGQSEMRVGIRSAEFGDISIRTSATPDLISAQISLDHSDLAKVLATHLPELQAKLGGGQSANVQIEMSAQHAGTSGGSSNSSAEDPQKSRQQPGGPASSRENSGADAQRYSPVIAPMLSTGNRSSARLDVRV
jgi:hypothetical protein